jgi:hypothetical protein
VAWDVPSRRSAPAPWSCSHDELTVEREGTFANDEESDMKHIVKRVTTTEEWVDATDLEVDDVAEIDGEDVEDDVEEDERPKRRAASHR